MDRAFDPVHTTHKVKGTPHSFENRHDRCLGQIDASLQEVLDKQRVNFLKDGGNQSGSDRWRSPLVQQGIPQTRQPRAKAPLLRMIFSAPLPCVAAAGLPQIRTRVGREWVYPALR